MKYIQSVIGFFSGKKTYIVGALLILLGLLQENQGYILEGLGFITVRAALKK